MNFDLCEHTAVDGEQRPVAEIGLALPTATEASFDLSQFGPGGQEDPNFPDDGSLAPKKRSALIMMDLNKPRQLTHRLLPCAAATGQNWSVPLALPFVTRRTHTHTTMFMAAELCRMQVSFQLEIKALAKAHILPRRLKLASVSTTSLKHNSYS